MGSRGKTKRRLGLYLLHGEVGADLIRRAGGREPIAAWTEIHQGYGRLEELGWPAVVVEALSRVRCRLIPAPDGLRRSEEVPPRRFVAAALAVAAAVLSLQLFVPPIVGLADNRDYERVMGYAGFQHTTTDYAERHFSFLRSKYAVVDPGWFRGGYHSSETLLAFVARGVHLLFAGPALFDIRLMSAIHAVLFLLALAGLIRACRDLTLAARAVVAVLLVFFFTDVGYVAPFNSFYSQTASFLFLLLAAAIAAEAVRRGRLSGVWLLAYFGAALLFVGSKPQEKLAAPLLALFGLRLAGVGWREAWRRPWRQGAVWLAAGLVAFSVWYGRHTPYTLREATLFQFVFDDLLAYSPVARRRRRRASPGSRMAAVRRSQSVRGGLSAAGVGVPDPVHATSRPPADRRVLPAPPEAVRPTRLARLPQGLVAAARVRQLRAVRRPSDQDVRHAVFAVEPVTRRPGSASPPRDRDPSRRESARRGSDVPPCLAPGPALPGGSAHARPDGDARVRRMRVRASAHGPLPVPVCVPRPVRPSDRRGRRLDRRGPGPPDECVG